MVPATTTSVEPATTTSLEPATTTSLEAGATTSVEPTATAVTDMPEDIRLHVSMPCKCMMICMCLQRDVQDLGNETQIEEMEFLEPTNLNAKLENVAGPSSPPRVAVDAGSSLAMRVLQDQARLPTAHRYGAFHMLLPTNWHVYVI